MNVDADINRLDDVALINLRGDGQAAAAFSSALDVDWPPDPGATCKRGDISILCVSPDQWLVRAPLAEESALCSTLLEAAADRFAAVTVVSDHYRGFRVAGKQARDILAQACSLDLDKFGSDQCARATFARTWAVIQIAQQGRVYDIFVESSYADYVAQWLAAAARVRTPMNPG